jgi:hypothetical protein
MSILAREFDEIKSTHMRRDNNQFVDDLATLASTTKIDYWNRVQPISIEIRNSPAHYYSVEGEVNRNLWYYDIKQFIQHQKYPSGASNTNENPAKVNHGLLPLFNLASSWPFIIWGIDIIGLVNLKASNRHQFILVAIDYFIKWVKVSSYAHVT